MNRRRFLRATAAAGVVAVAGCSGDGGNGGGGDGGSQYPELDSFLSEANRYDGNVVDRTGTDEVAVKVGAESADGQFYAFAPAAVKVSVNTTISWQWTGKGGQHNVVSVGKSDFDFDSGDPKTSGDPFEQSFDGTGTGLYECEPHTGLGMKGGFVVVE